MRRFLVLTMACLFSASFLAATRAAEPAGFTRLAIGDQAPDFSLPGVDGKRYTLASFAEAPLLLVVFTCNHCPTAQAYEERLIQLHADYRDKGVAVVAISPNDPLAVRLDELGYTDVGDSLDDMKLRAKERDFQFPYLYDGDTQRASLAYGVVATPQVFLFDRVRKLRYVGRIDDSDVRTVTSHDARNALDALLKNQPVPVEQTRVFGCSTKWSDKREDARLALAKWDEEPVELKNIDADGAAALRKNDSDKLLLVNVWATWCGPCLEELPDFVTIHRMYRKRKFEMVTISIDEPGQRDQALKFLRENHVSATNYLSAVTDRDELADLIDKDWEGPLPHTVLIAPGGKIIHRQSGPVDVLPLKRAIVDYLGRTYADR